MKKIIRLLPHSIYEAPALENWLSAQSEKGLFLRSANGFFAIFSKETPQKTTYHFEAITGMVAIPPQELLESYAAFGWEYVTCISGLYHVFVNKAETPEPLHTDPLVQSLAYKKIEKKVNNSLSITAIMLVYLFFEHLLLEKKDVITLSACIETNVLLFFLADILFVILLFFARLLPCLHIRRQMKAMQNGSFPTPKSGRKRHPHSGYCMVGAVLCLGFMLWFPFSLTQYLSPEEAAAQQGHTPVITLEEIEGLPPKYPIKHTDESTYFQDYLYSEDSSLLAPKQFILRQEKTPTATESKTSAYLWMQYVNVVFPALAEPLYQEKIEANLPEDAVLLPSAATTEADSLQIYASADGTYLFLRKDTAILSVYHEGTGDPVAYLDDFLLLLQEGEPFLPE